MPLFLVLRVCSWGTVLGSVPVVTPIFRAVVSGHSKNVGNNQNRGHDHRFLKFPLHQTPQAVPQDEHNTRKQQGSQFSVL